MGRVSRPGLLKAALLLPPPVTFLDPFKLPLDRGSRYFLGEQGSQRSFFPFPNSLLF